MNRVSALLIIGLIAAFLGPAAAASCEQLPPIEEGIANAAAVFVGEVQSVGNHDRTAFVQVTEVWKGDVEPEVTVRGGPNNPNEITSVDRMFAADSTYLFVVHSGDGAIFDDNSCSHTQVMNESLGKLRPDDARILPPPDDPAETGDSGIPGAIVVGSTVAAAAAVAGAIWQYRRRRDSLTATTE